MDKTNNSKMEENYKRLPPGLKRRMEYSRMLKNRQIYRSTDVFMTYEELSLLTPVYCGMSTLDYLLNTSISLGIQGDFCAICQDSIKLFSIARYLIKCKHKFHVTCLNNYCKLYKKCPLCREEII